MTDENKPAGKTTKPNSEEGWTRRELFVKYPAVTLSLMGIFMAADGINDALKSSAKNASKEPSDKEPTRSLREELEAAIARANEATEKANEAAANANEAAANANEAAAEAGNPLSGPSNMD